VEVVREGEREGEEGRKEKGERKGVVEEPEGLSVHPPLRIHGDHNFFVL